MMQNAFIGILCGAVADGDQHAKLYKQRMDELNYFLKVISCRLELNYFHKVISCRLPGVRFGGEAGDGQVMGR